MLCSEWTVFAESVASSLASSVGGSPPHILRQTQAKQLPPPSSLDGLLLSSTMFCKGCRVCLVAGLTCISSSASSGSMYAAEVGLLMMPLTYSGERSADLTASSFSSPDLPPISPLSIFFALRGRYAAVSHYFKPYKTCTCIIS
jgi:hypothetical protein